MKYIGENVSQSGHRMEILPEDLFAIIGAPSPEFAGELAIELKDRSQLNGLERKVHRRGP
jgi:hypothetical protein